MKIFKNEAKRSEQRLSYRVIPPGAFKAIAKRATMGEDKYGAFNYMKGDETFFNDAKNHLMEHVVNYLEGNLDDEEKLTDHLGAIMWNAAYLNWYENKHEDTDL